MLTEENLFEQLDQIAKNQPVKTGHLSHKQAKDELVKRGWVMLYQDDGVCGYTLTELGENIYGAKIIANKSALSGIGGLHSDL